MMEIPHDTTNEHSYYESSWQFIDKHTVRVTFQLFGSLYPTSSAYMKYTARYNRTKLRELSIRPFESGENNTNIIYLEDVEHGKHSVCLLIYESRSVNNTGKRLVPDPKNIFCQDIYFNYHKYSHPEQRDIDTKHSFSVIVFQYAIVCGILCFLHIVHSIRKRRIFKIMRQMLFPKANLLRDVMSSNSFETNTSSNMKMFHPALNNTQIIEEDEEQSLIGVKNNMIPLKRVTDLLIYDLNKTALLLSESLGVLLDSNDQDTNTTSTILNTDPPARKHLTPAYATHLSLPSRRSSCSHSSPFSRRSVQHDDHQSVTFDIGGTSGNEDENNFDFDENIVPDEEQTPSFQSMVHILEASKPWSTRVSLVQKGDGARGFPL
ncbi:unnamed protein product [Didymodactylos carnosus]|uniref:Uncharacterized protein n=1 Tax=Didymodactylos carnosus TaxID=1234261 RepID=A0A814HEZ0_9BILA|nr:unnamed protein product [Didymodactylos carnosus]CAF1371392.1 unnamed protein product [Didymodactylos carnosus]CAF3779860.1 unnamed protein product [Didymodactylos carnosus]CAF4180496.1 unnamed protein product [Didymodactylos carnosus]